MKRRFLSHAPSSGGPLDGTVVVLWHGAGGDVDQKHLVSVARAAADDGAYAVRARFAYRMAEKKAPDRMPKLIAHARTTIEEAVAASGIAEPKLILGGRSMGGRVASMLAAEGYDGPGRVHGLLFLSYPLHPAGKPDQLRDAHLEETAGALLFVTGDRDSLARMELLSPVIERLKKRATLEVFEGGDHGFSRVPEAPVVEAARRWWTSLAERSAAHGRQRGQRGTEGARGSEKT